MILDTLGNVHRYAGMLAGNPHLPDLVGQLGQSPCGRYELGSGYAMIQEGVTRPAESVAFEAHRNCIDVQILLQGREVLVWNDIRQLAASSPYDPEADIALFRGDGTAIDIVQGRFYVLFPWDGHKACCHIHGQTDYRKLVLKPPVPALGLCQ